MRTQLLTLDDSEKWGRLLAMIPSNQQDVYFTPEYYALYEKNGNGKACCFIYEEGNDKILYPFLLNSINRLGYVLDKEYFDIQGAYGYNGIVTSSIDRGFIDRYHKSFDLFCQEQHIVAEFSRFHPLLENHTLASPKMQTLFSRKTVKLCLQLSLDEIWKNQFSSKNRNVIRKAEKEGVTIVESHNYELFLTMYEQTMRNVNADDFYFFPSEYFERFNDSFGENLILCFAMFNGRPIAGSMFLFSKDYAHYHLSGRDKSYYKIAANNAILWYGIQKARERGCKWFHLGGGTTGAADDLLLHFKQNFSKENGDFWIGKRVHNQEAYNSIETQWKYRSPQSYQAFKSKLLGYRDL